MVRNNNQLGNAIIYCEKQIRRYTKLRDDLRFANQRGPGILTVQNPAPSPTNFPGSPHVDHLVSGAGVVAGPAINSEFSPSSIAGRGLGDLVPACSFGQGEYSKPFTPAGKTGIMSRLVRLARQVFLKVKQ